MNMLYVLYLTTKSLDLLFFMCSQSVLTDYQCFLSAAVINVDLPSHVTQHRTSASYYLQELNLEQTINFFCGVWVIKLRV